MGTKTILIDASLTGGRDPAKQAYEFITAFKERGVHYKLLTNRSFATKLQDLGLAPDVTLDAELTYSNERVYQTFFNTLRKVNFDFLVKLGARTASTYSSYKLGKPFVIVDGGLPDQLEEYPSLYAKEGYQYAKKYILCTHFSWKYPGRTPLDNIVITTYPFSQKTMDFCKNLRIYDKNELKRKLTTYIPEITGKYNLIVNLVMSGGFLTNPMERKTYGAWLTTHNYDECIGFLRRFITDLGIQYKGRALVIMDKELYPIVDDIFNQFKHIVGAYNKKGWNYEVEILARRIADVLVTRATNCIPNIAMMGHGGLATTPVPAHGYMDEDTAGYQAYALGLTELIEYDDESYMEKFLKFAKDKLKQKEISKNLRKTSDEMIINGQNPVDIVLKELT